MRSLVRMRRRVVPAIAIVAAAAAAATAEGADIGGWQAQQQQRRDDLLIDDCAEVPALAARTPRNAPNAAQLYFAAGLCYLESPKLPRNTLAASLWLRRAADLGHEQARRLLQTLPVGITPGVVQ
jgi:TPR repeat protein